MTTDNRASVSPATVSDGDRAVFSIDFAEFGLTAPDVPVVTAYDVTGLDLDGADRDKSGVDVTDTVYPDNVPTVSGTVVTLSPFRDPTAGHIYRVWCGVDQGSARLLAYIDITRVLASAVSVMAPPPPLPTAANTMFFTTTVPDVATGIDDDVALVRKSSLVVHAYQKSGGAWTRIWAFSGGDAVLLASGAAIPDRTPAADPAGRYIRKAGISAYAPVLSEDIDHANPQRATPQSPRVIDTLAEFRGGNSGTIQNSRANVLTPFALSYTYSVEVYVWFAIRPTDAPGLEITSVSQGGVDVPVVYQGEADYLDFSGVFYRLYRTVGTYTQAEIDAEPFELAVAKDAAYPATFNRYAVVTQNETPTAADFLSANARNSASIRVLIPDAGWTDGRGYLHFALPADQAAPTIAGQAGGINLIDDFAIRSTVNTIDINGDDMRTLSSDAMVFQMADQYSLFPWIIR